MHIQNMGMPPMLDTMPRRQRARTEEHGEKLTPSIAARSYANRGK